MKTKHYSFAVVFFLAAALLLSADIFAQRGGYRHRNNYGYNNRYIVTGIMVAGTIPYAITRKEIIIITSHMCPCRLEEILTVTSKVIIIVLTVLLTVWLHLHLEFVLQLFP